MGYYITRVGRLLLKRLEGWYEMDRLAKKFTVQDFKFFLSTKASPNSIFIKPNRFMKLRERTAPRPRKPMTEKERHRAEHAFTDEEKGTS
jgi:hypothetical protein